MASPIPKIVVIPPKSRVILWSSPRSVSIAFARSMMTLEECEVFNENFTAAYYMGPERTERFRMGFNLAYDHTYDYFKTMLEEDIPEKDVIFVKDFAYALQGKYDKIPEGYIHTFLIRNPANVFTSLREIHDSSLKKMFYDTNIYECQPECHVFFEEMWKLYRHVKDVIKARTVVIYADDLLTNQEEVMESYCQSTGILFRRSMLNWKPCGYRLMTWKSSYALQFVSWLMGWTTTALESSGFGRTRRPRRVVPEGSSLTPDIKEAIEKSKQYYELMYEDRLH